LIGRVKDDSPELLQKRFQCDFHTDRVTAHGYQWGVFLKYLGNANGFDELLRFDDIFFVKVLDADDWRETKFSFGLAFIADETRDINGMWIIPHGYSQTIIEPFENAWEAAKDKFCVCQGLQPSAP
jgi:hypothetical protein